MITQFLDCGPECTGPVTVNLADRKVSGFQRKEAIDFGEIETSWPATFASCAISSCPVSRKHGREAKQKNNLADHHSI
jgi:hypothetical protein